jgi:hypothetical protein
MEDFHTIKFYKNIGCDNILREKNNIPFINSEINKSYLAAGGSCL